MNKKCKKIYIYFLNHNKNKIYKIGFNTCCSNLCCIYCTNNPHSEGIRNNTRSMCDL